MAGRRLRERGDVLSFRNARAVGVPLELTPRRRGRGRQETGARDGRP